MILGNQVEWALHCMTVLASMPKEVLVSARQLAEFHGVPKEYLAKSLQSLSVEGLVITTLGPAGGYRLARSPDKIKLLEIVEAVEGKRKTFHCQEIRQNNPCSVNTKKIPSTVCSIASVMYKADNAWREVLRRKKLSDIIDELKIKIPAQDLKKSREWFFSEKIN